MNLSSIEDFQHVTGVDLSSIIIDNDIMPLRDSDHYYDLRGIDIAFLMEAAEERRLARNLPDNPAATTFVNAIRYDQVQGLADKISYVGDCTDLTSVSAVWYDGAPVEITAHNLVNRYPNWLHQYEGEEGIQVSTSAEIQTLDYNLKAQPIQEMFDNIGAMKTLERKQINVYNTLPAVDSYWVHQKTGGSVQESNAQYWAGVASQEKAQYGRVIWGTDTQTTQYQSIWKLDVPQTDPDYIPDCEQCKNTDGEYAGREVYGLFWTAEGYQLNHDTNAVANNYFWILKVSDEDGLVTGNSLTDAINRIKNSGASNYNFDPSPSIITGWNTGYHCAIRYSGFFIFDTMGDRTRWDVEDEEDFTS